MTVENLLHLQIESENRCWNFKIKSKSNFYYGIIHNSRTLAKDFGEYHAILLHTKNKKLNKVFPFIGRTL